MKKALVIGAGISGIASAIRLSRLGYKVRVVEQSEGPGGKIAEFREGGFRFDMGPSLFTMPGYVDELFELCEENAHDHFDYEKLDIVCRYFYEDGLVLDAYSDQERLMDEFSCKTGEPRAHIARFLKKSKELYDLTSGVFIRSSLSEPGNYFTKPFINAFFGLHRLDPFRTMHEVNDRSFSDQRLVQLFDRYATYNGSDPFQAPATLNVISHLEHGIGAFFPRKGMYDIVKSLVSLAERNGVEFIYDQPVTRLIRENNRVRGLETGRDVYHADVVVSSVDVHHFYRDIMPEEKKIMKLEKQPGSSSAMIFYWGVKGQYPSLDVHNILFSSDYRKEFDHLFNLKTLTGDPTVYIFISSRLVSGDAPPGFENWFVMVNTPENTGQDWEAMRHAAREAILDKIEKVTGVNVRDKIVVEKYLDPAGIERRTSSYKGSLYGNSSNNMFAAFNRHPNRSRRITGLYFTGGSVHPGGGIPLCPSSAKIVAGMVEKDEKTNRLHGNT